MMTEMAKRVFLGAFTLIAFGLIAAIIYNIVMLAPMLVISIVATLVFLGVSLIVGILIYPDAEDE